MLAAEGLKRVDFWEGVPPDEMFAIYRRRTYQEQNLLLGVDRLRAFARVREAFPDGDPEAKV